MVEKGCLIMKEKIKKLGLYLGLSQDDAIRAVCILNGCSPEEVKGIVDESPFKTFEQAEAEAIRSAKEEGRKLIDATRL